ncbi:hypothetical protein PanWU01x14_325910 [Parasponia andersonii]|uniref:Uncharacterized protein n=1 Tax=Parasponia andersonii TaxID=3476 RepID=A0A2P5AJL3_PARAD|nr:hypothetical protein PanWU01x14_325910 [Parasponia andersonii]
MGRIAIVASTFGSAIWQLKIYGRDVGSPLCWKLCKAFLLGAQRLSSGKLPKEEDYMTNGSEFGGSCGASSCSFSWIKA